MNGAAGKGGHSINREQRIAAFVQLGRLLGLFGARAAWPGHSSGLNGTEYAAFDEAVSRAQGRNAWFTEDNVRHMLRSLSAMLSGDALGNWLQAYPDIDRDRTCRTVGLVTAGNIPLVGFHDLLCVLLSGHCVRLKVSSDDAGLTPAVLELLRLIAPDLAAQVTIAEQKLGEVDAVIATGSNNTARYFEHYLGHLPRIIRKNRTSVAVLDGMETEAELTALGEDLFRYFGLGCRNVSKLFVPQDFDL